MTWEVLLVEGMVVNFDLRESSEVVWHQHDGHIDVLQLPEMCHSMFFCLLSVLSLFFLQVLYIPDILFVCWLIT